jgi:hypothetical protein
MPIKLEIPLEELRPLIAELVAEALRQQGAACPPTAKAESRLDRRPVKMPTFFPRR